MKRPAGKLNVTNGGTPAGANLTGVIADFSDPSGNFSAAQFPIGALVAELDFSGIGWAWRITNVGVSVNQLTMDLEPADDHTGRGVGGFQTGPGAICVELDGSARPYVLSFSTSGLGEPFQAVFANASAYIDSAIGGGGGVAIESTGNILLDNAGAGRVYGTIATPLTGVSTLDLTGAVVGGASMVIYTGTGVVDAGVEVVLEDGDGDVTKVNTMLIYKLPDGVQVFRSATKTEASGTPDTAATITGTFEDGNTVTANPGTWGAGVPTSINYEWFVAGVPVQDSAADTYDITLGDATSGGPIKVEVEPSGNGVTNIKMSPEYGLAIAGGGGSPSPATITGDPEAGKTLTGAPGTWTEGTPAGITWQWKLDAVDISGATTGAYVPTIDDILTGGDITVLATPSGIGAAAPHLSAAVTLWHPTDDTDAVIIYSVNSLAGTGNGALVSTWPNGTGVVDSDMIALGGREVTYTANDGAGFPCMTFAGVDENFRVDGDGSTVAESMTNAANNLAIIATCIDDDPTGGETWHPVMVARIAAGGASSARLHLDTRNSINPDGNYSMFSRNVDAAGSDSLTMTGAAGKNTFTALAKFVAGTQHLRKNGTEGATEAMATTGATPATPSQLVALGANQDQSLNFVGRMYCVMMCRFDSAPTDAQLKRLENFSSQHINVLIA